MLWTVLLFGALAIVAFGLSRPFSPRRLVLAAVAGLFLGLVLAYFNVYPGSLRAVLGLLAGALVVSGVRGRMGRAWRPGAAPLVRGLPAAGVAIALLLVGLAVWPYTSWGAASAHETIYDGLRDHETKDAPPALPASAFADVRVVPWDLATELLQRGYGQDASFLDTDPYRLTANTFPDTVNDQFVWVHAPAPETAKWLLGGIKADKVLYVKNDAGNLTPAEVPGTLNVQRDGVWWQDRVARYAEDHGELRYVLEDVTLQLDDSRTPYWIGYLARVDLKDQRHLEKLLVINANTGAETEYAPQDAPAWIEQVYPESYVYEWASYWGLHREGFLYRWFNANRLVQPDDVTVRYIRLDEHTYWLLPMRQLASAQLGGYILVDTRTGNATFYDRFAASLIDYDTAHAQLAAIMASGAATQGAGSIRLAISEGYLYPIRMADGAVREAYVFPLLEGLKVSRFAIIDAHDYTTKRVFGTSIEDALRAFSELTGPASGNVTQTVAQALRVVDGTVATGKAIVDLNGTYYSVTTADLADGTRHEPEREMDELTLAIARASRGQEVTLQVLVQGGRVVDVTYPEVRWG